jgi:hypothetical protein
LQFGKAQGRQQHLTGMLCQLVENHVSAVAGMNGDISVEKVCQEPTTPSIPPTHRNIDRLPLLDVRGLWHAAQGGDCILQAVASGENRDDLTQSYDLEIYVGIRVGELGRYANSLAIAGFEHAGPRHGSIPNLSASIARERMPASQHVNPCIYEAAPAMGLSNRIMSTGSEPRRDSCAAAL